MSSDVDLTPESNVTMLEHIPCGKTTAHGTHVWEGSDLKHRRCPGVTATAASLREPSDLDEALRKLDLAIKELEGVYRLPTTIGCSVRWTGNGVVWKRVGPNAWTPLNSIADAAMVWPSSHIAAKHFEQVV